MYFNNKEKKIQKGDQVFGLVYGKGVVKNVWEDGHYNFEVEYEINHQVVPYTLDGVPGWSSLDFQTVFYCDDVAFSDIDISPLGDVLPAKTIIKLRNQKNLEIRCPSGIWRIANKCPQNLMEEYLEENKLHLFRRKI